MPRLTVTVPCVLGAALCGLAPVPAAAAAQAGSSSPSSPPSLVELGEVRAGQVLERVGSEADPARSYALYLPSGYDAGRAWPVLLVMDPRGRAPMALELFRPAAERLGWLVLSSWDTRSDDPDAPNEAAVEAMLADVQRFFNVHPRRFYLAGFSGTARVGWQFAVRLRGNVAGLVGVGAGLPADYGAALGPLREYLDFAFFGGAGRTDFNFEEVRRLDQRLDRIGTTHRVVHWEGAHGWPPADVCGRALEWLELQAMRSGLREPDDAWIRSRAEERRAAARALAAAGRTAEAAAAFRALAEDFEGMLPVDEDRERAATLAATPPARRAAEVERELAERHRRLTGRLASVLEEIRTEGVSAADDAIEDLRIAELRAAAAADPAAPPGSEAADRRDAARRLLETYFVHASYYEPRRHLEEGDPARALAVLAVAEAASPGRPRVCWQRARAHAVAGRPDEAVRELECLAGSGQVDAEALRSDPHLSTLHEHPGFRALLGRLAPDG